MKNEAFEKLLREYEVHPEAARLLRNERLNLLGLNANSEKKISKLESMCKQLKFNCVEAIKKSETELKSITEALEFIAMSAWEGKGTQEGHEECILKAMKVLKIKIDRNGNYYRQGWNILISNKNRKIT